jgi:histidinol phosphatase-like enzyme (inositol monophosphatase family)
MNAASDPIQQRLAWAVEIARQAGDVTLQYFRQPGLAVEYKGDASPVTVADRSAEQLLRRRIAEKFPDDAILGEELGESQGRSSFQWILDPIDGTKSFVHGVPLYTTLIGVLADGQPTIGVIHAPATGETASAAVGGGCFYRSGADTSPRPARVSSVARLADALVLTTDVAAFSKRSPAAGHETYLRLQQSARLNRTWGDGYGYLLVATGRAEVMIDPEMNVWDTAALLPVIEEAGGQFTDWQGQRTIHSGDSVGSNGVVAREVLAILKQR